MTAVMDRIIAVQEQNNLIKPLDHNRPLVIGFSGKKRHGKDYGAKLMAETARCAGYQVHTIALADALKREVATYLAWRVDNADNTFCGIGVARIGFDYLVDIIISDFLREITTLPEKVYFPDTIPIYNPDAYRRYVNTILAGMYDDERKSKYRLMLQYYGTEFRRNICGNDYWLKQADEWIDANVVTPKAIVLVTDVRFPDEVDFIVKTHDGLMIRVERPGLAVDPDAHSSENLLDDYDGFFAKVVNNVYDDDAGKSYTEYKFKMSVVLFQAIQWAWGL